MNKTRIVVLGAAGRMGRAILRQVLESTDATLVAAVEQEGHSLLGQDAGEVAGAAKKAGVVLTAGWPSPPPSDQAQAGRQVWIDFSSPAATAKVAEAAVARGVALVVGTTGLTADHRSALAQAAQKVPVVVSANMSVGVNVLLKLVADAARALGPDYDLEIVEAHHRMKRDAPSGTALRLAEALAEATGRDLAKTARYHREGDVGPRTAEEIGIQTIRGGDVVGDHTVFFLGQGERVEITHRASSRDTFARGAVRAALWLQGRPAGLYDMRHVLGFLG